MKKEAVPIWEPDVSLQAVPWGSTVQSPEESAPGDPVTHRLKCDFTDGSEMAISELKSWPGENLNIHENYHRVHAKLPSPRLKSNREYMGSRSVAEGRTGRKGRGGRLRAGTWNPAEKIHTMLDDIRSCGSSAFPWAPACLSEPESGLTS